MFACAWVLLETLREGKEIPKVVQVLKSKGFCYIKIPKQEHTEAYGNGVTATPVAAQKHRPRLQGHSATVQGHRGPGGLGPMSESNDDREVALQQNKGLLNATCCFNYYYYLLF